MSAEVTSPHAIDDETLAAFADGRLDENERAVVRAHLDGCAECRDTVNLIAEAQDEDIIPRQATVIRGGRFRRYAPWMAAAAAAAVIFSLPTTQERVAYYRTAGVSQMAKDSMYLKERPQQARLTGGFPHKRFKVTRGPESQPEDTEGPLTESARNVLVEISPDTTSVKEARALAFAYLFTGKRNDAVKMMEQAVQLAGEPDAALRSDLSAMYLERARFGDDDGSDKHAALKYAQEAWKMEQKPEYAWNLALAYEALEHHYEALDRNNEALQHRRNAIAMWTAYLELDPSSPWAGEAKEHLANLNDPYF